MGNSNQSKVLASWPTPELNSFQKSYQDHSAKYGWEDHQNYLFIERDVVFVGEKDFVLAKYDEFIQKSVLAQNENAEDNNVSMQNFIHDHFVDYLMSQIRSSIDQLSYPHIKYRTENIKLKKNSEDGLRYWLLIGTLHCKSCVITQHTYYVRFIFKISVYSKRMEDEPNYNNRNQNINKINNINNIKEGNETKGAEYQRLIFLELMNEKKLKQKKTKPIKKYEENKVEVEQKHIDDDDTEITEITEITEVTEDTEDTDHSQHGQHNEEDKEEEEEEEKQEEWITNDDGIQSQKQIIFGPLSNKKPALNVSISCNHESLTVAIDDVNNLQINDKIEFNSDVDDSDSEEHIHCGTIVSIKNNQYTIKLEDGTQSNYFSDDIAIRNKITQHKDNETDNENAAALDKLSQEKGWKKCPKCSIYIERSFGCRHMKCPNCSTNFCDSCGEQLDPLNWKLHFTPPNICRLWEDIDDLLDEKGSDNDIIEKKNDGDRRRISNIEIYQEGDMYHNTEATQSKEMIVKQLIDIGLADEQTIISAMNVVHDKNDINVIANYLMYTDHITDVNKQNNNKNVVASNEEKYSVHSQEMEEQKHETIAVQDAPKLSALDILELVQNNPTIIQQLVAAKQKQTNIADNGTVTNTEESSDKAGISSVTNSKTEYSHLNTVSQENQLFV